MLIDSFSGSTYTQTSPYSLLSGLGVTYPHPEHIGAKALEVLTDLGQLNLFQVESGRKFDLKLNSSTKPIVNKYREGKLSWLQ